MKKKISKAKEKECFEWIEKRFNKYRSILNLNNWQLYIKNEFVDTDEYVFEIILERNGYTGVSINIARSVFNEYLNKNWQYLNRCILHELSHILIHDLVVLSKDRYVRLWELRKETDRVCDNLSVIFDRLMSRNFLRDSVLTYPTIKWRKHEDCKE